VGSLGEKGRLAWSRRRQWHRSKTRQQATKSLACCHLSYTPLRPNALSLVDASRLFVAALYSPAIPARAAADRAIVRALAPCDPILNQPAVPEGRPDQEPRARAQRSGFFPMTVRSRASQAARCSVTGRELISGAMDTHGSPKSPLHWDSSNVILILDVARCVIEETSQDGVRRRIQIQPLPPHKTVDVGTKEKCKS
jgi:hypothetical protein